MEFYNKEDKNKKTKTSASSYLLETPDPDRLTPQNFKKGDITTPQHKESSTPTPDGENVDHLITENISEISANDYGFFTLKIQEDLAGKEEKDEKMKRKKTTMITETKEVTKNYMKFNLVNHLGDKRENSRTGEVEKIAKNRLDLISYLAKEENDYILFDILNVKDIESEVSKKEAKESDFRMKVIIFLL